MVGEPSIVFRREAVVDETFFRDLTNLCKTVVGIDASQLYPFSLCQAIPTVMYTRCQLHSESGKLKPRRNKTRRFENTVMLNLDLVRPQCKVESFYTTGTQKKLMFYSVDGFCGH